MTSHYGGGGSNLQWTQSLSRPYQARASPFRGGRIASAALAVARRRKERTYPEFVRTHRCRLVVFAIEVSGRWINEIVSFIRSLARARALKAPARLRPSIVGALIAKLSARLTHTTITTFASSLFKQILPTYH